MLTDTQLNTLTSNGELQEDQLKNLFDILDFVGVEALWVDKNFQHYKFNNSNKRMSEAVKEAGDKWVPYTELLNVIYDTHTQNDKKSNQLLTVSDWMANMRKQQKQPMVPHDDYVLLSSTGKHFISRRVFLNNGSMLVISFNYSGLNKRDNLIKVAFEASKSGAIRFNLSDNSFVVASPYLERILTPEEYDTIQQDGLFSIIHPDDLRTAKEIFKRSLVSTKPITRNIRIVTQKKKELWFKYTGQLEIGGDIDSTQHISTFEDITEELKIRDNLRQNIQRSNAELKERLDFMAKLSHELKTPMNAIIGISDALIHKNELPDDVRSKLELIQSSSETLVSMLDDTLSHAKLKSENTSLNLQAHDPVKVIGDICKLWEHQALKKGTLINFKSHPNVPPQIMLDRSRLGQCLNNLISNAAKFTEYGQIDVVVKLYSRPNRAEQLAIIVRDNGIGMTQEQLRHVFTAYKQADETISSRFGGTGLGMSITKDLIELMGGKITVNSVPDNGTLFLVLIPIQNLESEAQSDVTPKVSPTSSHAPTPVVAPVPLQTASPQPIETSKDIEEINAEPDIEIIIETPVAAPVKTTAMMGNEFTNKEMSEVVQLQVSPPMIQMEEATEEDPDSIEELKPQTASQRIMAKSSINPTDLNKLNVLVVDDNETNHIVMSSLLDGVVGKIYSAFNGQEALDTLKIEHVDLVLMDIHMPVMDGIEATIAIRTNPEDYPDVRIIALTADPQYQQKRLCVNIGMDEAMAKPVKLLDLIDAVKKTMDKPINNISQAV